MGFDRHCFLHSFAKRCGFPVSEEHAAGDFDSLTVDPEIVVGQQGRDRAADVVGQADAPKGSLRSYEFVDLFIVTHNQVISQKIKWDTPACVRQAVTLTSRNHFSVILWSG